MNKSLVFTPGCKWEVKSGVLFVEYESMTGEHVRARFDLSPETEYITDGYKLETIRNICEHSDDFFIRRVRYYEQENHMLIGGKMLVPTKVYFEAKAKKTVEETHNKLLQRIAANSAYGISSRDWGDVLADSARYIHMQRSRCSGKTLWLSSATSFAGEQPLCNIASYHGICKQWLKQPPEPVQFISDDLEDCEKGVPNTKLIDPNRYFDTDMAMTREEMMLEVAERYCRNDVAVTEKLFKEEQIMRFDSCKPTIKKVIFNEPATIVMWSDGTKTVVKCGENDIFDPEKGVAMACMKKLLGTNKTGSNYLDKVQEYFDNYDGEQLEKCLAVRQRFMKFLAGCVKNGTDSTDIPPEVTVDKEFEAVTSNDWTVVPADENTTAEEDGE